MRDSCIVTTVRRMPRTTVFEPSRPDEAPETRAFVKVQGILPQYMPIAVLGELEERCLLADEPGKGNGVPQMSVFSSSIE